MAIMEIPYSGKSVIPFSIVRAAWAAESAEAARDNSGAFIIYNFKLYNTGNFLHYTFSSLYDWKLHQSFSYLKY